MISVASYNIRKSVGTDWRRDPGRIFDIISAIDADIIALQEVDRRFGSRAASLSPQMVAERSDYFAISFGVREQSLGWHGTRFFIARASTCSTPRP
jgi:endonuclease/exonuclease/phosphatase family metal-dependent hydrolase